MENVHTKTKSDYIQQLKAMTLTLQTNVRYKRSGKLNISLTIRQLLTSF